MVSANGCYGNLFLPRNKKNKKGNYEFLFHGLHFFSCSCVEFISKKKVGNVSLYVKSEL